MCTFSNILHSGTKASRNSPPLSFLFELTIPSRRRAAAQPRPRWRSRIGRTMSSTLVPGVVVFCKLRNGTSTLGWYECVVVACPGGAKGDVRVDVVEKLAPQLQDGSNNGPVRQLVSSADGTSFTSCPEAAQAAATALALETAGPRKRRQPSSWADEKKDPQQSRPSAPPEKKQRSRPTAPAQVRARAATLSPWPQQPGPSRPAARPGSTRTLSPTPTLGPQPYPYPWPW